VKASARTKFIVLSLRRLGRGAACLLAVALLAGGSAMAAFPQTAPAADYTASERSSAGAWARGRILVAPKTGLPDAELGTILRGHGAKSQGRLNGLNVHVVELPVSAEGHEDTVAAAIAHNPNIKFAEVDRLIAPSAITDNDTYFSIEWHLPKIFATTAWSYSLGTGVTIAILDSGVDSTHPDLSGQLVPGWNFYDNNSNTSDVTGHGTAVAGTAAAASNNGTGVSSVAGGARIMPVRIADPTGYAYWSTVAQGITWAADHGARVASLSYEGASASSTIISAAQYLRSKGGVLIVAAGNTGTVDNTAPTPYITVVSATDQNDAFCSFSSYGSFVDISAPGTGIISTMKGGGYGTFSGTSFATPIVAASAALVIAKRPDFAPSQVDSTLLSTATDLGALGPDIYFGHGRVNAAAAVQQATATSAADTTPPSVAIASPTGGTVSGTVAISVNATDNVGVAKVDLRINGSVVASDTISPYQYSWNSATLANGTVTVTAVAYDAAGNSAVSAPVSLNVSNATLVITSDTTPPSVVITSPTDGSVVFGTVAVRTSASDNSGAAGITQALYIDSVLKATVIGTPLSYNWNTRKAAKGTHSIQVKAHDAAGNTKITSISVTR
jgi:thermitase